MTVTENTPENQTAEGLGIAQEIYKGTKMRYPLRAFLINNPHGYFKHGNIILPGQNYYLNLKLEPPGSDSEV